MNVEFYKHNITDREISDLKRVLNSIFLTTGREVERFENDFSKYLGVKHTVGVTSATAGLHLALLASNIGPGDEVITTPMSFCATSNSVIMTGAEPVFVDVEPETGNINADKIERAITKRTKAIIPVHLYGLICDMKKIKKIAKKHKLIIIEDCAHCIEGERDGVRPGMLGDYGVFSFYATKSITSGEGGAITVHKKEDEILLKKLRSHGITREASDRYGKDYVHWDMDVMGWKYNMFNIQASLLLNQLKLIEKRWLIRERICRKYEKAFLDNPYLDFPKVHKSMKSARHLFTVWVDPKKRDRILHELNKKGIQVAVNYRAIHLLKYYSEKYGYKAGDFPCAEKIGSSTITLPLYPKLTSKEVDYIIKSVNEIV